MFPFRDHNPSRNKPVVNWFLIAINVLVFLAYRLTYQNEGQFGAFLNEWGMKPGVTADGERLHTLFSSMFLHAGFMHLGGNMMFLWIFGDNMEDTLGRVGYLLFYLLTGLGASAAHMASDPASMVPTVGASGAVAGVMGGYLLFFPRAKVDTIFFFRVLSVPAWVILGAWFGLELYQSVTADPTQGGVAHWAHTGGLAFGLVCMLPFWFRKGGTRLWRLTQGKPPHPPGRPVHLFSRELPGMRP